MKGSHHKTPPWHPLIVGRSTLLMAAGLFALASSLRADSPSSGAPKSFQATWLRANQTSTRTGSFRIYAPPVADVPWIRGVVFLIPGSIGDWRVRADDIVWQEAARSLGFALIGWKDDAGSLYIAEEECRAMLDAILTTAAATAGRPELANAPFVSMGFSAGGYLTTELVCKVPERMIAGAAHHGANSFISNQPTEARKVPLVFLPGSLDTTVTPGGVSVTFRNFRGVNAPDGHSAFAVNWLTGHDSFTNQGWPMAWTWAAEAIALRYPADQLPSATPAVPFPLLEVPLADGWLGARAYVGNTTGADRSALSQIAPFSSYDGEPTDASWLPNETVARVYRAHNSYDGISRSVIPRQGPLAIVGDAAPVTHIQGGQFNPPQMAVWPLGSTLNITVDPRDFDDVRAIASMEFHDGDRHIGTLVAPGASGWTLPLTLDTPGIRSLTVAATDTAGNKTAAFRTVVVSPPRRAFPEPILELTFNDAASGSVTASTGHYTGNATFINSEGAASNLRSAATDSLTGQTGDRAFDNRSATGMGSKGVGGGVSVGDVAQLDGLMSFTLQGWFKAEAPLTSLARFFDKNFGAGVSGFCLRAGDSPGQLVLQVNSRTATSPASYGVSGQWVFFAVTYDAQKNNDNVAFYIGGKNSPVSLVGRGTIDIGGVAADTAAPNAIPLVVGNITGTEGFGNYRPFDGLLDNMRIYGASSGGSGALRLDELELVRVADGGEPASFAGWRYRNFKATTDDGAAAASADPDQDGLPNLLEYALATSPQDAASGAGALPRIEVDAGVIGFTFFRGRADVDYVVQTSADLVTWSPLATNPGEVGEVVRVPLVAPQRAFARLVVSAPVVAVP